MNKENKLRTNFGPGSRFDFRPAPPVNYRASEDSELERLKHKLLRERLANVLNVALVVPLRRAANEAAALAWVTPYPLLVFPELFEEKLRLARLQVARQMRVRSQSPELIAA